MLDKLSIYIVVFCIYLLGLLIFVSIKSVDTSKEVRKALIWPIYGGWYLFTSIFYVLNESVNFILLAFNFKYKDTLLYYKIDKFIFKEFLK